MSITEFIELYESTYGSAEPETDNETLNELTLMVQDMFKVNCGEIPEFELTDGARKIKLKS
jgi:hypothetical protein